MKLSFEKIVTAGVGGGFVSATLVVDNDAPFECDGLDVTLTGQAWARWREGQYQSFKGEVELFKHHVVVLGRAANEKAGSAMPVAVGRQEFQLAFALPQGIPPSMSVVLPLGAIEYLLKADCRSKAVSCVLAVHVHGSRWPGIEAAFSAPRTAAVQKKFFMSSSPCRALLQIDNPIGHVGSVLQGHVVVDNASGDDRGDQSQGRASRQVSRYGARLLYRHDDQHRQARSSRLKGRQQVESHHSVSVHDSREHASPIGAHWRRLLRGGAALSVRHSQGLVCRQL